MLKDKAALLSTAYFGPVQYYTKFLTHDRGFIEIHDHYTKQTYRNRCNVYGANGLLPLSIPVLKGRKHKSPVRDIKTDDSRNWKKLHWKGIESAYMHSPFFEYYMDEIRSIYDREYSFLMDMNMDILHLTLTHLEIASEITRTDAFIEDAGNDYADYRELIHPRKDPGADPEFLLRPYQQVFIAKHGFLPNLSILDLLFNEGPNARTILEESKNPNNKASGMT